VAADEVDARLGLALLVPVHLWAAQQSIRNLPDKPVVATQGNFERRRGSGRSIPSMRRR